MSLVEPDYQPYQGGAFRWRLGLRVLDLADWIQIGPAYERDLAAKRDVLARHPGTVLSFVQGIQEEASEVLRALTHHLTNRWPQWFTLADGVITNHRTGETFALSGRDSPNPRHPLDTAGRLVQEDLVLLVERAEGLVVGGGSVCFPNRWDLGSKLGLRLVDVHAPVSRLNDQLGGSVETFFERLRPDRSFWRLGWSVLDTGELYQPTDGTAPPVEPLPGVDAAAEWAGERLFLRVERETFRRFPDTGCVLFTLRTYVRPLAHLATRRDDARRLAEALQAMPSDVADYKKVAELTPTAVAWLDAVTAGSALEADGS